MPWDRTIVYELHVRGYTKLRPDLPEPLRGTFAGLGSPQVIDYIKSLGVTSVELMPVHRFVNDRHLVERGLTNYWGYNSIGFFAPDPRYLADPADGVREFREMVARFHDAGLEVILDVVYNHTAEGSELGPTLSFKGIDNASYYRLVPDNPRYYNNDAGTGNTLNSAPSARDADDHRQPALLGGRDARRRVPVRSRHHARAAAGMLRRSQRVSHGLHPGPGAGAT